MFALFPVCSAETCAAKRGMFAQCLPNVCPMFAQFPKNQENLPFFINPHGYGPNEPK